MHEELGLSPSINDVTAREHRKSDLTRDEGDSQEVFVYTTQDKPSYYDAGNDDDDYADIPIIDSLAHFVDNFEKLKEFNNFEKQMEGRKSNISKRSEAKDLKNYLLVHIL